MAEDKNVGDRRTVLQGDVAVVWAGRRIPTSSLLLKGASWRAWVARAAPPTAGLL